VTVEWARADVPLAPTRPGGFDDTPVGRLPTGPAADSALAAAAQRADRPPATVAPAASRRGVAVRRAVAAAAVALGTAALAAALRARRGR
jgi:hypothetical protein